MARGVVRAAKSDDFDAVTRLYRQLPPNDPVLADDEKAVPYPTPFWAPAG